MFRFLRGQRFDPSLQRELTESGGRRARALAWAQDETGTWCVLTRAGLFLGVAGDWRRWRWTEIEHGSWNNEAGQLRWQHTEGVGLFEPAGDPGDIPLVFKELVESSILVAETVEIPGTRNGGQVAGRRDPAEPNAPIVWTTSLGRGTPNRPENQALLDEALARMRAQYE